MDKTASSPPSRSVDVPTGFSFCSLRFLAAILLLCTGARGEGESAASLAALLLRARHDPAVGARPRRCCQQAVCLLCWEAGAACRAAAARKVDICGIAEAESDVQGQAGASAAAANACGAAR